MQLEWPGRRVLVTGAGGFIGSHLVEALVAEGAKVRALVHYNSRGQYGLLETIPAATLEKVEVVTGDLTDSGSVNEAVKGTEAIFHLGALIAIPYSYRAPLSYVHTNVEGTLNVLQAALAHGAKKVVHTSTSEVYGTAKYVPMDEGHPLQGQSPYSASKIGADMIAMSFHRSFGLPVATIRPFNCFGPRQSARAVIPTIISQLLTRGFCELGVLHPTRDFTFVKDTVRGFLAVAASPKSVGEVINIGSNREISVGDLVKVIAGIVGCEPRVQQSDDRKRPPDSEVERLFADTRKAAELLGWKPSYTLEAGLKEVVDWIRENTSLFKSRIYNV